MDAQPPKWADRILALFCPPELIEFVKGDLHEIYFDRLKQESKLRARIHYLFDIISTSRLLYIKSKRLNSNKLGMYKNYLKVAWRNMLRFKSYSFIKITGFAISIAACFLISLFILDEVSYDKHITDSERIYRLRNHWNRNGDMQIWPAMEAPMKKAIDEDITGTEKVGRLIPFAGWYLAGSNMVNLEDQDKSIYEEGFVYADQEFIDIIDLKMRFGNRASALDKPNTIVISNSKAQKFFGDKDPTGELIFLNNRRDRPFTIGGVMEDLPSNSQFAFDFIITLTGEEFWEGEQSSWCCSNYMTYIKLEPGRDPNEFAEDMMAVQEKYQVPYFAQRNQDEADEMRKYRFFSMQPITDVHLYSSQMFDVFKNSDIRVIYMFATVAFFILLLAIVNFVNLSVAKSSTRSKEVGIRKTVGSKRSEISLQFLIESFLFTGISFVFGLLIAWVTLPLFNNLADKSLAMPWTSVWFFPLSLVVVLVVGMLAGLYPSFVVSRLMPVKVLKGDARLGAKGGLLQSALVTFQFTTCVVLIIATIVVKRQMDFILNKNLGFDKEQVVMLRGTNTVREKLPVLQDKLRGLSDVKSVTTSSFIPLENMTRNGNSYWMEGKVNDERPVQGQFWQIDDDYLETLGMNLASGRNFSDELASDTASMIINQSMAEAFGLSDPLGARITNGRGVYNVVGVVEDFHFQTMTEDIGPLAFVLGQWSTETTSIRVQTGQMRELIGSITSIWEELMPNQPIRIQFMDERFAQMYEGVKRTGQIFFVFAAIAISIAGLGLFALSAFLVEQRRKEISIRKVLGATPGNLFQSLSMKLLRLVLFSLLFALPLGWYAMKEWLTDYAYPVDLSVDIFITASVSIVAIALAIVSYELLNAIKRNPAETLHME